MCPSAKESEKPSLAHSKQFFTQCSLSPVPTQLETKRRKEKDRKRKDSLNYAVNSSKTMNLSFICKDVILLITGNTPKISKLISSENLLWLKIKRLFMTSNLNWPKPTDSTEILKTFGHRCASFATELIPWQLLNSFNLSVT